MEQGCGKSTQIPQYLMRAGYTKMACTQPRWVNTVGAGDAKTRVFVFVAFSAALRWIVDTSFVSRWHANSSAMESDARGFVNGG